VVAELDLQAGNTHRIRLQVLYYGFAIQQLKKQVLRGHESVTSFACGNEHSMQHDLEFHRDHCDTLVGCQTYHWCGRAK
jgi:hypothetical protein